jgi:hypothetical protein
MRINYNWINIIVFEMLFYYISLKTSKIYIFPIFSEALIYASNKLCS